MATLERAIEIATKAHMNDKDLSGDDYINHPLAVMEKMPKNSERLRIIAVLHDVVEDKPTMYGFSYLEKEGFGKNIIDPLKKLTRSKGESYWDYIRRVADDDAAIEVKLADIAHNTDPSRVSKQTKKITALREKYEKAKIFLTKVKEFKPQATVDGLDLTKSPHKYILNRYLFEIIRNDYAELCDVLHKILEAATKSVCASAIVQGRTKKADSFTEKCARKANKYGDNNFREMTDLCGLRVILQTTGQVEDFCAFVEENFDVDSDKSDDTSLRLGDNEFGYLSKHYIISVKPQVSNILGVKINTERFKKIKAEIQVRTFAQHIWADTLHDRIYKTSVTPLKEHNREVAKIASNCETMDAILHNFVTEYDKFSLNQKAYMTIEAAEQEIIILKAMNYGENNKFTKLRNALRQAEYLRSLGRYKDIGDLLKPFVDDPELEEKLDNTSKTRINFEYGLSLLAPPTDNILGREYVHKALKSHEHLEDDISGKFLEARKFYVYMLVTAATLSPNETKWFERALKVDPTNPYACAELLGRSNVSRDYGLLTSALTVAKQHLRAGINEPEIYFVLGRIYNALGDKEKSFMQYIDGLLFYHSKIASENIDGINYMEMNPRTNQILAREMQFVEGEGGIYDALSDIMHYVYNMEAGGQSESKTIWVLSQSKILKDAAEGYKIRKFASSDLSMQVAEMKKHPGYLFIETKDEALIKTAIALGLKVICTNDDLNIKLVQDEKIRSTKRYYTLPCEFESLFMLFAERKSSLTDDQINSAAISWHEKYVANMINKMRETGKVPPDLGERTANWDKLAKKYKLSNIDHALCASILFEHVGYEFNEEQNDAVVWDIFDKNVKDRLARLEHGRWNAERVVAGWCYHPERDNEKLLHDCITAWDNLSDDIKRYDFEAAENIINDFRKTGLYLHKK